MSKRLFMQLLTFFRRRQMERELDEEIQYHIDRQVEENIARGMSATEARRAAMIQFNGVEQRKEECRDVRPLALLEGFMNDVRYACRILAAHPAFALTAVLTIAIGISINTAAFSVYNAIALRPLPVSDPGSVVRIRRTLQNGSLGDVNYEFSYAEAEHLKAENRVFSSVVFASALPVPVLADSEKLQVQLVSPDYFSALGIQAAVGRTFLRADARTDTGPPIVLSHAFWRRRFAADPNISGQLLKTSGPVMTIIGVAPAEFTGTIIGAPVVPDFWAPVSAQPEILPDRNWLNDPTDWEFNILARLRPDVSRSEARAQVQLLLQDYVTPPSTYSATTALTLERTSLLGNVDDIWFRILAAAFMFVVGMVLVVACANVANMVLAHGTVRQREIAIRLAIGAGRRRVIRQLVTESLLLSLAGGAAGLALSVWVCGTLWSFVLSKIGPFLGGLTVNLNLRPDIRVFAYTFVLSLLTGIVFGLLPAIQITRGDFSRALKDEGGFFAQNMRRSWLRRILIAGQVTISVVFLISGGLLMRGFLRSQNVDIGFDVHNVFGISTDWGRKRPGTADLPDRVLERIRSLPEVAGVSRGGAPFIGTWTPPVIVDGHQHSTLATFASNSYFDLWGIPIVRGRTFTDSETENGAHVAVISESTARLFWPNQDPLQKHFTNIGMARQNAPVEFEVIGIAKDVRFANPTRIDPAHIYIPPSARLSAIRIPDLLFRIQGNREQGLAAVRRAIGDVDRSLLPYLQLNSFEDGALQIQRLMSQIFGFFVATLAALALALASVGIYGVMAYVVNQRIREIGIRMALGAPASAILRAIVYDGMPPVIVGLVLGLGISMGISWAFHMSLVIPGSSDFLYGVPFYDPLTFTSLTIFLIGVAALASLVPARRALGVDPLVALRNS